MTRRVLPRVTAGRMRVAAERLGPPAPPSPHDLSGVRESPGALIRMGGRWYPYGWFFDPDAEQRADVGFGAESRKSA
jgi:hypothetical protein